MSPTEQQLFTAFNLNLSGPNPLSPIANLPDCSAEDTLTRRLMVSPDLESVYFPRPDDVAERTTFLNPDDRTLAAIFAGRGDFRFQREVQINGQIQTLTGRYDLCRVPDATQANARIFAAQMPILQNSRQDLRGMAPIRDQSGREFLLTNREIIALVRGAGLDTGEYSVSSSTLGLMWVSQQLETLNRISNWLDRPEARAAFPDASRRATLKGIVDANAQMLRDQARNLGINPFLLSGLSVLGGVVLSLPAMIWMQRRNERMMKEMQERNEALMRELQGKAADVDPKTFIVDETEKARGANYSSLVGQERVLRTLNLFTLQPDMPHVILTGPAGSGKSATLFEFFHRNATGNVPHLQGRRLLVLEAGKLSAAGAVYAGLSDKVLQAFIEEAKRQPSVVWVREAHQLVSVGLHSGNTTSGALEKLKAVMEDPNSGVTFILDSDRTSELTSDQAIARRTQVVTNEPPRFADVLRVVEGYAGRYAANNGVAFEAEAQRAIALLADYKPGAAPSSHKLLMGNLVADAKLRGEARITLESVVRLVGEESRRSRAEVQRMLAERMRDPRIVERIWAEPYIRHAAENGVQTAAGREALPENETPAPTAAPAAAANPLLEVLAQNVNDASLEAALRNADTALADFYRANLSNAVSPVTTVGELARRIAAIDPTILSQSQHALASQGLSIPQAPERFVFEVISRSAARGGWTPANPTELPTRRASFETEMKRGNAIERRAGEPADAALRETEERARREAEARRGRP